MTFAKGWLSKAKGDVVWAVKNPNTVRKAIAAGATSALTVLAFLMIVLPSVSGAHAAGCAALVGILTHLSTFFVANQVVEPTDDGG